MLDFFRHPAFFKSQFMGGHASDEEREMMTQMVRDIRSELDAPAVKKGHPK